ncbi:MAG: 4Fe-4S binding protein [Desulfobulbaceae bacterium]|nr:4Fe-4S binding protein [Desulfobulbaceae bacterium]
MASSSLKSVNRPWYAFLKNRRFVQASALVLSNAYFLSFLRFIPCGYLQCSNCSLSTFSCPLILVQKGAVMMSMGMFGVMSAKVMGSIAVGMAILFFFGSALGAWACGWLCPFGFLQDMLGKIPVKKFSLPAWSGYLRIPIFIGLAGVVPYLSRRLFFCDVCPSGTINRLWQQAAGIPLFFKTPEGIWSVVSVSFLIFILALAIFTIRPFCGLFCPIGGLSGLLNKISGLFLKVDKEKCVSCNLCQKSCPQGINPSLTPAHSQCVRCLECTGKCKSISLDLRL